MKKLLIILSVMFMTFSFVYAADPKVSVFSEAELTGYHESEASDSLFILGEKAGFKYEKGNFSFDLGEIVYDRVSKKVSLGFFADINYLSAFSKSSFVVYHGSVKYNKSNQHNTVADISANYNLVVNDSSLYSLNPDITLSFKGSAITDWVLEIPLSAYLNSKKRSVFFKAGYTQDKYYKDVYASLFTEDKNISAIFGIYGDYDCNEKIIDASLYSKFCKTHPTVLEFGVDGIDTELTNLSYFGLIDTTLFRTNLKKTVLGSSLKGLSANVSCKLTYPEKVLSAKIYADLYSNVVSDGIPLQLSASLNCNYDFDYSICDFTATIGCKYNIRNVAKPAVVEFAESEFTPLHRDSKTDYTLF